MQHQRPKNGQKKDTWASLNEVTLGQLKTTEKSNEITAILDLLDSLFLRNCIVTIDAMGCQKKIAAKIREKGADYILSVTANLAILSLRLQILKISTRAYTALGNRK